MTAKSVPDAREDVRVRLNLPRGHKLGVGHRAAGLHQGHRRAIQRCRAPARDPSAVGGSFHVSCRSPRQARGMLGEYSRYARTRKREARARSTRVSPRPRGRRSSCSRNITSRTRSTSIIVRRDFCFVSSLHDGMNLVAKEFVAARDDERGVLILSQFAGAARELPEALIVNPYDADECAQALQLALTMPIDEQRDRMRLMRSLVREFNVYRWAGRMLLDASAMRQRRRFDVKQGRGRSTTSLRLPDDRPHRAELPALSGAAPGVSRGRPRRLWRNTARCSSISTARSRNSPQRRAKCGSTAV